MVNIQKFFERFYDLKNHPESAIPTWEGEEKGMVSGHIWCLDSAPVKPDTSMASLE